ncbi:terpene synthase family protein [Qaidamihabitans albus]|uniref:terpene synthase family protein n=1 Tax=Qaidamihabitans albus TaxID=2795733 RepID=UPI0018F1B726|nr:hypothetical protein [Qaidamihabitans albus]
MPDEFHVEIPLFFCPFDPVLHPGMELAERRCGEWASNIGLAGGEAELARWHAATAADFYGGMVPDAPTDRYQVAVDWAAWGFSFDDAHCDEDGGSITPERFIALAARLLRILDSGDERLCHGDRHLFGLWDLARRYQELATATQFQRWVTAQQRWLFGVVQQTAHRAAGGPATFDDYLLTRLHDAGGPPVQAILEFANDEEVPGAEMDAPRVRAVTELFWMIASLDNDRVSRHKERLGQRDHYNAVDVLARELGLTEAEAVEELVGFRDGLMVLFLRLREQLARGGSKALRTYLDALGHGIRSNIDWSLRTPRYATLRPSGEYPAGATIRLHGGCTGSPAEPRAKPPPPPSVAWWWTQLS